MEAVFPFTPNNISNDGVLHCPHCGTWELNGLPFKDIKQVAFIGDQVLDRIIWDGICKYSGLNANEDSVLLTDYGTKYIHDFLPADKRFDELGLYTRTCPCCNQTFFYTYIIHKDSFYVFKTLEALENWITLYKKNDVPW